MKLFKVFTIIRADWCETASRTRDSWQAHPGSADRKSRGSTLPLSCPHLPRCGKFHGRVDGRGKASLARTDLCIPVKRGAGGSPGSLPSHEPAAIPSPARLPAGSSARPHGAPSRLRREGLHRVLLRIRGGIHSKARAGPPAPLVDGVAARPTSRAKLAKSQSRSVSSQRGRRHPRGLQAVRLSASSGVAAAQDKGRTIAGSGEKCTKYSMVYGLTF
jgi:hypothetical protein